MNRICSVVRRIAPDHPSFSGHFPSQPVLPGVFLLAEVLETLLATGLPGLFSEAYDMRSVKFLSAVRPGDDIRIDVHGTAGRVRFEVHCGDKMAASGQVAWKLP